MMMVVSHSISGSAVMGVRCEQEGAEHTALGASGVEQQRCEATFRSNQTVTLFTQLHHIISGAVVCQFCADGDSPRAKHLRRTAV